MRSWFVVLFKQKKAYDMRISDWSSDVCSSDLLGDLCRPARVRRTCAQRSCRPGAAGHDRHPIVPVGTGVGRVLVAEVRRFQITHFCVYSRNRISEMKMLSYPARLEKDGAAYVVSFRDIPEALTSGRSQKDALRMAADALVTAMDFYFEDRREVP